jgi:hypothetical protein
VIAAEVHDSDGCREAVTFSGEDADGSGTIAARGAR